MTLPQQNSLPDKRPQAAGRPRGHRPRAPSANAPRPAPTVRADLRAAQRGRATQTAGTNGRVVDLGRRRGGKTNSQAPRGDAANEESGTAHRCERAGTTRATPRGGVGAYGTTNGARGSPIRRSVRPFAVLFTFSVGLCRTPGACNFRRLGPVTATRETTAFGNWQPDHEGKCHITKAPLPIRCRACVTSGAPQHISGLYLGISTT